MKISKLLLLIFVVSVCSPVAFAQTARGLKYVPQAVKGARTVPYVVSPKLSPALRTNLAVPVVRPSVTVNVAPAVERAVAAKVSGIVQHHQQERQTYIQQQRDEQPIQQICKQEELEALRAWRQVRLQDKAWKAQPEEIADPAENAAKAAELGEQQLSAPSTVTTDDYVEQLLNFYNKLDPWGTGTIQ